jgi:hypothetical protein
MPIVSPSPLTFKLRPDEREQLRHAAEENGVGPSTFAAEAVRRAIGTARRRPIPQRASEVAEAVREATGQLGRLGNNINQIAHAQHIGETSHYVDFVAIRVVLAAIDARLAAALETA